MAQDISHAAKTSYEKCAEFTKNLWWSWHPEVGQIFQMINPERWRELAHNPIALLREYDPQKFEERVLELDRAMFVVDGQFDRQHIYVDAVIPLQNGTGDRFLGRVLEIRSDVVVVDLNHPLAGKTLNFRGTVVHCHEASEAEIQQVIRQLASGACGGCCGGDCDDENCGNGGCGGCGK